MLTLLLLIIKEALSVLMLCTPSNHRGHFRIIQKIADFENFMFCLFSPEKKIGINSEKCIKYGK